jgi:unsaturated rhamnogalacturonyl hydrolase
MILEFFKQIMDNFNDYHGDKKLTYEDGLMLLACERLSLLTGDLNYLDFNYNYLNKYIREDGSIESYKLTDYNIDNILSGNALFKFKDKDIKFDKAINLLASQLSSHPRTSTSNFFHKFIYQNQIWLDGLYMGLVFYYRFGILTNDNNIKDDVINQLKNVRNIMYKKDIKLYMHAYDEVKTMQWADPLTGLSHIPWSRSIGWLLMALIDIYELSDTKDKDFLKEMYIEAINGVIPYLDKDTHMMYQIVNGKDIPNNYLETSGSSMLAYSLQKAYNLGILDISYSNLSKSIFEGIIKTYLKVEDSKYYLGGICKVAGLDNKNRDGSIRYYLSEPITKNEIKGVGPFMFTFIEICKMDKDYIKR